MSAQWVENCANRNLGHTFIFDLYTQHTIVVYFAPFGPSLLLLQTQTQRRTDTNVAYKMYFGARSFFILNCIVESVPLSQWCAIQHTTQPVPSPGKEEGWRREGDDAPDKANKINKRHRNFALHLKRHYIRHSSTFSMTDNHCNSSFDLVQKVNLNYDVAHSIHQNDVNLLPIHIIFVHDF